MVDLADRLDADPELRLVPYFFNDLFGRPPAVVRRVPGAIPLLTEEGRSLAVPVRWGAIVAASPRPDDELDVRSMNRPAEYGDPVPGWAAGIFDVLGALRAAGHAPGGATLLAHTDVPQGCGLAAGAALACAAGLALAGPGLSRAELAEWIPGPPGVPAAALFGRHREAVCAGNGIDRLPFDLEPAGLRLLIIVPRTAGPADGVRSVPPDPAGLIDAAVARLNDGNPAGLGPLLTAAHAVIPDGDTHDLAFSAALEAGALGARAISDGPGTAVIALARLADLPRIRAAVTAAHRLGDLPPPRLLTAVATVRAPA